MSFISSLGAWLRKTAKSFTNATVSGNVITLTRHNGDAVTITTQDTVYDHPTYIPFIGKPTINQTPDFGDIVIVSQITSDGKGHVTAMDDKTITIPATEATTRKSGLMSATDKQTLDAVPNTYMPNTVANLGSNYVMNANDFTRVGYYRCTSLASSPDGNAPDSNPGDYHIWALSNNTNYRVLVLISPRMGDKVYFGHFWNGVWQGWTASARLSDIASFIPASVGSETNPVYSNSNSVITPCNNTNLASALINALGTESATPYDDDYFISQYANGGTNNITYYRRPLSALHAYHKGKFDDVYLALAGGTLTGHLYMNSAHIINARDDTELRIHGGTTWGKGASLVLHGNDKDTNAGVFMLYANANNSEYKLRGTPDGALKWFTGSVPSGDNIAVVSSYSATSYYIRLSNGLQMCAGSMSIAATGTARTFPVPFSEAPRILFSAAPTSANNEVADVKAYPRTATGFTAWFNANGAHTGGNAHWFAYGRWK